MPDSDAVVTIRIIKSFQYRTIKNLVLHVDLSQTSTLELKRLVKSRIETDAAFLRFRGVDYDTLKIHTKAHGMKTSNLVINMGNNELVLKDDVSLASQGIENETEISFFNYKDYEAYKTHPETKW
mmetsp:Transcript_23135/g.38066  ORF Transcript_23135/g.38066 Transcript_23135/m.38066 type:complete len:125 (-) Transcript_23135:211-585(-)